MQREPPHQTVKQEPPLGSPHVCKRTRFAILMPAVHLTSRPRPLAREITVAKLFYSGRILTKLEVRADFFSDSVRDCNMFIYLGSTKSQEMEKLKVLLQ